MTTTQTHTITPGADVHACTCGATWPAWTPATEVAAHVEGAARLARLDREILAATADFLALLTGDEMGAR